jgi:hypothetical protein
LDLPSFKDLSPWLQGLFGGAGVTFLWEVFLRPSRARRSVARVLAEEVSIGLEHCAAQRLQLELTPTTLPADFQISANAFDALANQLGELPASTVGGVVLFYHQAKVMNGLPIGYGAVHNRWQALATAGDTPERKALKEELERYLLVYKMGLEKMVERANELLPQLRRLSVPMWRVDYLLRKKKLLSIDELQKQVAAHGKKLEPPKT